MESSLNPVVKTTSPIGVVGAQSLADESVVLVRSWLDRAAGLHRKPDASSERLAGVLKDPQGPAFALGFVDGVARPEELLVAGRNFRALSRDIPAFLPGILRILIQVGGFFAPIFPALVVPIARWALKILIGHLIIDASDKRLTKSLRRLGAKGDRLNINLLGEAVLGDHEADRRWAGVSTLIARPDVDYVSVKVSSISSQLSMWAYEETVERVVKRLIPLYQQAAATTPPTFINLDMEEFKDLDMTIDVFEGVYSDPSLKTYTGGLVLQGYLPEALAAMKRIQAFASARVDAGGACVKVRVVKGANLQMEQVDAAIHDWPVAVLPSKQASDTNYKRVLEYSLTPAHTVSVRIGVAGHNLFDVAFAHLLAQGRGVAAGVDFEMLIGMAPDQADAVRETVGHLLLYTPVVHPKEFDAAVGYLVRRLDENASPENFMSAVFDLYDNGELFTREENRFRSSLKALTAAEPEYHRVQDRRTFVPSGLTTGDSFHNEADTDPSLSANRQWAAGVRTMAASAQGDTLGRESLAHGAIPDSLGPVEGFVAVDDVVARGRRAGTAWGKKSARERATILLAAGEELNKRRGELLAVMMQEAGKTLLEGDPEVSEAIDFARYYAKLALELEEVDGATFQSATFTLVTPPWNFPVAIPAGSVLSALAAGSAVAIKPAPQVRRCGAVMVEALWSAGVPRDVLQLLDIEEGEIGQRLISHPGVDRLILTGAFDTAKLFRSWRADLPLLAETSGKNAVIVTSSADFDLAVADVVKSAFGHAGQKCSAASLVILVGSVGRSARFRRQLVDAVTTLRVGYPEDPEAVMGPVIEPPGDKLRSGLTDLADGESWILKPEQRDEQGRLWSPGVRGGVKAGSEFHQTEYFGPVLGIMTARTLKDAIAAQNGSDYGLTAGIHSLDTREIEYWLDHVQAGNCYVNRGITGAIVQRQSFGGWKRSSVGPGSKAGGPNYLFGLGSWSTKPSQAKVDPGELDPYLAALAGSVATRTEEEADFLHRSLASDHEVWASTYGVSSDPSAVGVERNVFRYHPREVTLRVSGAVPVAKTVRVCLAALRVGAKLNISLTDALPDEMLAVFARAPQHLGSLGGYVVESEQAFVARVGPSAPERIRLLGGEADALAVAFGGAPEVAIYGDEVTESGRVEMLPFVKEQAVSLTAHRFGAPDSRMLELVV
ncbi:MAG: RHH-type proline utilization regulon transcriptional repressor/proline dehydrogenase [Pontimonas sp.]|jgi:RHH-type proline utilization regulon transcriptional repressor/proline dehydrogenase/delta 1-pyrroline-5-carboxylate dehydrogenase